MNVPLILGIGALLIYLTSRAQPAPTIDDGGYPSTVLTGHALHEDQVRGLYRLLLNREPDSVGFYTYVGELDSGVKTVAMIEQNIRDSDEYRSMHP